MSDFTFLDYIRRTKQRHTEQVGQDEGPTFPSSNSKFKVSVYDQAHPQLTTKDYTIAAPTPEVAKEIVLFCLKHGIELPFTQQDEGAVEREVTEPRFVPWYSEWPMVVASVEKAA